MTTMFIICFLVGLGLSVVSFFSGFDEISLLENLFHSGHGHGHGGHGQARVHVAKTGKATGKKAHASAFNLATITAFLVWFGGGGLLLQRLTPWSNLVAVAGATGIGIVGGSVINRVITLLMRRESTAETITMTGLIAKVTIPIRAVDGTGEIVYTHQGTRHAAGARSDTGIAIDKGSEVVVTKYEKGIAYVATWDELSASAPQNQLEG